MKRVHSGFTLVEVLIALALFSIMLSLLFATLQMASRNWEAGEKRADTVTERVVVERFLRRTLGAARTWDGVKNEEEEIEFDDGIDIYLEGTNHTLEYIAPLPLTLGVKGPQRFTLYLGKNEAGDKALKVKVVPLFGEVSEAEAKTRDLVLMENIQQIKFQYWHENDNGGGQWREAWEEPGLPRAVQIEIVATDGMASPPIVVGLRFRGTQQGFGGGGVWGGVRGN